MMDLKQKHVKLAPINGVAPQQHPQSSLKDRNRLKRGCTSLMYSCQQGFDDSIVKEIRSEVKKLFLFHYLETINHAR
jgi:hypothetical protein